MTVMHQEHFTELSVDIVQAISNLSDIAVMMKSTETSHVDLVLDYKQQLDTICDIVEQGDYKGFFDLMAIYSDGLDTLSEQARQLSHAEVAFIEKFPHLLSEYLNFPSSKITASILVRHFKDEAWLRPVTDEEYDMLMAYILDDERDEASDQQVDEELDVIKLSDKQSDVDEEALDINDLLSINNNDEESDLLDINSEIDLNDFIETSEELALDEQTDNSVVDNSLSDSIADTDLNHCVNTNVDSVKESMDDVAHHAVEEVSLDDFIDMQQADELEESSHSTLEINGSSDGSLDDKQQELIDLVRAELAEIIEAREDIDHQSSDALQQSLVDMAEQVENIGNAVALMGMDGITHITQCIASNIMAYSENVDKLDADNKQFIHQWPEKILGYLQDVFNQHYASELIAYIKDKQWQTPLAMSSDDLLDQLIHPIFTEEDVEQRQSIAEPEDISLELPDDVNQELLEGLLQDLPAQTEEFSTAVQNLCEGGGYEDIEKAQRIAHTLKGAANVVGVRGIANITHHLEDILEAQAKAKRLPIDSLLDVLLSASDCLEAMSEALLGVDEAPSDALQILQNILDWANRLDKEGVPEKADDVVASQAMSVQAVSEASTINHVEPSKDGAALENMLRIPVALADDLLRLAGENLISTGQIQEHISTILKSQDAIQLHNQSLQQLSFDLEHLIDIQGVAAHFNTHVDDADFDPLEMDQYNELHSVSRRLIEIASDSVQLTSSLEDKLTDLQNLVISQNSIQKESQELVLRTRMVSIKNIIPRLRRGVRQACRVTGKQVELNIIDNDTYLDSDVLNELIEPLMHLLRNSVDHGIETGEQRRQAGKPDSGYIQLSFMRMGGQVVINIEDDGRGLNLQDIRSKALDKGLIRADMEMNDDALSRLIFESGFTTRDEVTQVSGRGIGLDVVSVKVRELKGSINIESHQGAGCRFELTLPISSFSTHSILVRVRQHIYAISNRGVEEILYPGAGEICEVGDEIILQIDDQAYSTSLIDDLLDLPEDRRDIDRSSRPILIVRQESGARTAILVQDVLDSRDVVVKPLGKYLPKLPGVVGATVLGDGSVAPVMDMPELLQSTEKRSNLIAHSAANHEANITRLPYVLVVDDSLSARRSLAQFVEDLGLDVRTARDGMEAVSLIEARQPDLLLVDMEMPRMNGLELTSHVRASTDTVNVPVIMITSRSTDKHKQAAIQKGVNHFMVKPFAEEELAQHINEALDIAS